MGAQNTVIAGQQTQINSQGGRIGSLEVENAQQGAAFGELFVREADQQRQIGSLRDRDKELSEGVAIALSLGAPTFLPGQEFAMRAGWGNFDGSDVFGVTAGGVIDRGSFGHNSSVILDGGVGFGLDTNTVAGKAGLSFGWHKRRNPNLAGDPSITGLFMLVTPLPPGVTNG